MKAASILRQLRSYSTPAAWSKTRPKTFYHKHLTIEEAKNRAHVPSNSDGVGFGKVFTDHFVEADWEMNSGWGKPKIRPLGLQSYHPGMMAFHYGLELFEGMKAYYGVDKKIRLFRPELNMQRMRRSAERSCFPDFDTEEAIKLIEELVRLDSHWVPKSEKASLYIRPVMIATDPSLGLHVPNQVKWYMIAGPAGSYFETGNKGVSLLADPSYVRSWPGGVGAFKMGCNYAPTIYVGREAAAKNCQQVLWLSGEEKNITEAGAMNVFLFWKNEQGEDELITAPVDSGLLLPGVTRQSILELAKEWKQFKVTEKEFTMDQFVRALKEKRVYEFFGAGTAAVVGPISEILYLDKTAGINEKLNVPTLQSKVKLMNKFYDAITGIQYGKIQKPEWTRVIEV